MKDQDKTIRTNVILPESLWEKTKFLAVKERTTFTEVVRRALTEYMDKRESKKKEKGK